MIRRLRGLAWDCAGSALVEAAAVLPLLVFVLLGVIQYGFFFFNYSILTNATTQAALLFSEGRSSPTPWSNLGLGAATAGPFYKLGTSLMPANSTLTVTTTVNGAPCASDSACQNALTPAQGQAAAVTATYPCPLVGLSFAPGCTMTSTFTGYVQ